MPDAEETRREWARRVAEAYDGWPGWAGPGAAPHVPPEASEAGDGAGDAGAGTPADPSAGHTSSGWSWGLTAAETEAVDRRLSLERRRGGTEQAIRDERAYWGLGSRDD